MGSVYIDLIILENFCDHLPNLHDKNLLDLLHFKKNGICILFEK